MEVREKDEGGGFFLPVTADPGLVLGDDADDGDGYDLFILLRSSLVIMRSGSGGGRPPRLAPAEEDTRGDPVGVSLGL